MEISEPGGPPTPERTYDFAFIIGPWDILLLWGILVNPTFTNKYIRENELRLVNKGFVRFSNIYSCPVFVIFSYFHIAVKPFKGKGFNCLLWE